MLEVANVSRVIASSAGTNPLKSSIGSTKRFHLSQPELLMEARYAATQWDDKLRRPSPPLLRLSCACIHSTSAASTAVHSAKHWRTSLSNSAKPSAMCEGGAERAKWTNLQNALLLLLLLLFHTKLHQE